MASIRKRGHRWEAQVRKAGVESVNKLFLNKSNADRWACQTEAVIERGETTSTLGIKSSLQIAVRGVSRSRAYPYAEMIKDPYKA